MREQHATKFACCLFDYMPFFWVNYGQFNKSQITTYFLCLRNQSLKNMLRSIQESMGTLYMITKSMFRAVLL